MIHANGTRLVDGNGEPIRLRGVLLEGWLMWNGTLWGAGLTSETKISDRLEGLVGRDEAARFREAIYDSFIAERDIEMIADLGLNVVRVPFNHTVLEKDGAIDESAPGWKYLDRLLDWCEKHEVYVVLDLHAVPGGQSGVFVADPDSRHVWGSEADLQRTVELWRAIATRYHSRSIVAGYDLINEPEPPKGRDLVDLYRRIIRAIRSVDPHHLVVLAGTALSTDFSLFDGPLDENQAYTFHTYDFFTHDVDEEQVAKLARLAEKHDVPLWNGEFGAHTADWTAAQIALFEDPANHVNGWIYWPWKRVSENDWRRERFSSLMEIQSTEAWDVVRKHVGSLFGLRKTPKEQVLDAMAEFLVASAPENLIANKEMVTALRSWQASGAAARAEPTAGGSVLASGLDGAEDLGPVDPGAIPLERISLERVTADGGRLDWSPDGSRIVFDRKGADGLTDIWEIPADDSDQSVCLTCRAAALGLPEGRHIGQPAYHPSGEWIAMQVERAGHHNDSSHPHPGAGVYHDVWVLHRLTDRAYRLTEVSDGRWGRPKGGSLHPVFSHDGEKLLWTDMENGYPGLFGDWRMALATFDTSEMPPRLRGPQYLEPGREGRWFETHGFGPDDNWIYFSGNVMDTGVLQSDIAKLTLATGELQRLTFSAGPKAGEPGSYEESAHFTKRFDAFSHLSSEAGRGREELWLASPDGNARRQVTRFNEPGSSDHELVDGLWSMPSDNAWNPQPPPGREQLLLYLQVDFNPLQNVSRRNEIFLIEFVRTVAPVAREQSSIRKLE